MLKQLLLGMSLLLWLFSVQAGDFSAQKLAIEKALPNVKVDSIQPLEDTGLYEVIISGEILYFSEDLKYVFQGDVIELATRSNITEAKKTILRKELLASVDPADFITYEPKKTDYTLTVFTDIDCGYCRKLHNEMAEYNALGIKIQYMAYPRAGVDSEAYEKAVDVWCADDRQQAMTDAKNGLAVNSASCDSPVKAQYEMGRKLGVNGTPSLFLESGEMLPGYVPPKKLRKILDQKAMAAMAN